MIGQKGEDAVTLLSQNDLLAAGPNKDEKSSLYNMVYHANAVSPYPPSPTNPTS
jgi:hypothetical protein